MCVRRECRFRFRVCHSLAIRHREEAGLTMNTIVRLATEADFEALTRLDLMYTVGDRYLALERSGAEQEPTFSLRWREGVARDVLYDALTVDGLRKTLEEHTDAFFVATLGSATDAAIAGYLMIVMPRFTDAAEITDVAVDRPARRSGAGRALIEAAVAWARERNLRALWVEPQGKAGGPIDFYLKLGFRISGTNDRWYTNTDDTEAGEQTIYMYLELG